MDSAFNRTLGLQEVDDIGVWNECTFDKSQISLSKGGEFSLCILAHFPHLDILCVLVAQSCLTLCDPVGHSPPDSAVQKFFQARTLELVAISFSRRSSWARDWTRVSCIAGKFFNNPHLPSTLPSTKMSKSTTGIFL